MMNEISDLIFADAVFSCQISGKLCQNNGECSECDIASYFISLDADTWLRIREGML